MIHLESKCLCKLLGNHCPSPYVLKSRPFHLEFKWLGQLLWSHCASPCIPWLVMHPRKPLLFFQFEDKVYQFVKQAGFIGMQFCSMLPVSVMDHNVDRLSLSAQWTNTHREIFCTWVWKQTETQPRQENSMTDNVAMRWELPLVQAEKSSALGFESKTETQPRQENSMTNNVGNTMGTASSSGSGKHGCTIESNHKLWLHSGITFCCCQRFLKMVGSVK